MEFPPRDASPSAVDSPNHSGHSRVVAGMLASGIALGASAGLLYWWNDSRNDKWKAQT
jgi:hypothetical protein